jgi:hypothetical protein
VFITRDVGMLLLMMMCVRVSKCTGILPHQARAHRSQDSAGKSAVRMQYFGRSTVEGNYTKNPIFPDDEGSQKGEPRGPKVGPDHRPARPKAGRAA